MTKYGLAYRLTSETGRVWTEEEAQELIDLFDNNYETFSNWRKEKLNEYLDRGYLMLPDGWYLWGDNDKFRSVANAPIQGMGAVIMRRAVALAQDAGLDVIFTLHDAIYIEYDFGDLKAIDTLKECMEQAFIEQFEGEWREHAKAIRVDPQTWGIGYADPDLVDGNIIYQTVTTPKGLKVPASSYFYDPRAAKDFDMIKKYMFESSGQELLG